MDTQDHFEQLKARFAPALQFLERSGAAIQMMNVQDNRLLVRAAVQDETARERILEEFRRIDPSLDEVHVDVRIQADDNVPSTGQSTVQTSQEFSRTGETPEASSKD